MLQKRIRKIELEIRDTLMYYIKQTPEVIYKEHIRMEKPPRPSFNHNYERERWEEKGLRNLYCDGNALAIIQRSPHLVITVVTQPEKSHFIQKTFERIVNEYLPEASVMYSKKVGKKPPMTAHERAMRIVSEQINAQYGELRAVPGQYFTVNASHSFGVQL